MTRKVRMEIYEKYNGHCAYCGCELEYDWQVDHAISKNYWWLIDIQDANKVNDISNLEPACKVCNHYKRSHPVESTMNIVGFREYMSTFHIRLGKLPKNPKIDKSKQRVIYMNRIADRYNISPSKPFTGIFYKDHFKP